MRGVIIQEAVARYHWLFASRHDSRSREKFRAGIAMKVRMRTFPGIRFLTKQSFQVL